MTLGGWAEVAIGECVERAHTVNPTNRYGENEFVYVDLGAVDQAIKAITMPARIKGTEAPSRARQVVASGDVLVSTVRPNLNAVAQVGQEHDGAIVSTGFSVLRPSAGIDGRYLFHWVQSPSFVAQMVRRATGASYPAVSDRIVRESTLPLAPLHEQRRIAHVLDVATTLCARRRRAVRRLAELRGSVLAAMTARNSGDRTRSCSLASLIAAGDRINYGVVQPGEHVEGGVPLIRAGDIQAGRVVRRQLKTIAPSVDAAYSRSRIVGNEVLVTCVGSVGLVALTSPADVGSNVVRAIARVPIESAPLRRYVAAYLETIGVQRYFASELRTVAQPTLNIKQIRELEVPIPTDQSLEHFHRVSSAIDRYQEAQVAHLAILDELFASVQHRAFAGAL